MLGVYLIDLMRQTGEYEKKTKLEISRCPQIWKKIGGDRCSCEGSCIIENDLRIHCNLPYYSFSYLLDVYLKWLLHLTTYSGNCPWILKFGVEGLYSFQCGWIMVTAFDLWSTFVCNNIQFSLYVVTDCVCA